MNPFDFIIKKNFIKKFAIMDSIDPNKIDGPKSPADNQVSGSSDQIQSVTEPIFVYMGDHNRRTWEGDFIKW